MDKAHSQAWICAAAGGWKEEEEEEEELFAINLEREDEDNSERMADYIPV
jgi:hypothetical protein